MERFKELIGGTLGLSQKIKQNKFSYLTRRRKQALKKKKARYILELLSVVYGFEKKRKHF